MSPSSGDVWFVDVGQGHATVAISERRAMVIDCPRRGAGDVAGLLEAGSGEVDAIVVTHRDLDHCAGIRELIERHPPAVLYINPSYAVPPSGQEGARVRSVLKSMYSIADERAVEVAQLHRGDVGTVGTMAWRALAPTYRTVLDASVTDATNRSSIVLSLEFGDRRMLVTGDIDGPAIAELLRAEADLAAEVLLVPHHGGATPGLDQLVDAVSPRFAVISAGRDAGSHPARSTLDDLRNRRTCRILCTQVNRMCHREHVNDPECAGTIHFRVRATLQVVPSPSRHRQRIDTFDTPVCLPAARTPAQSP